MTLEELLSIYQDPSLGFLDLHEAAARDRIYHQLWRNTVFAEWMAAIDHPHTEAFHVNLVRAGSDADSAAEFQALLRPEYQPRFRQLTWESLYDLAIRKPGLSQLARYLRTKTAGLRPAFQLQPAAATHSA